jgi:hypothetical protein
MLVVLATLALTATAFGGEVAKSEGTQEGIKVHGHWKIEIFNPDGTRASVHEFDNALTIAGKEVLVRILGGSRNVGAWRIRLHNRNTEVSPCENLIAGGYGSCYIGDDTASYGSTNDTLTNSWDLSVSEVLDSVNRVYKVVLTGSVEAGYDSNIVWVDTQITVCDEAQTTDCRLNPGFMHTFTNTELSSPPSVVIGQLIQVTVEISFS